MMRKNQIYTSAEKRYTTDWIFIHNFKKGVRGIHYTYISNKFRCIVSIIKYNPYFQ